MVGRGRSGRVSLHALWTLADLGVLDDERFLFHVDAILKTPPGEDEPSDRDRLPSDAGPGHGVTRLETDRPRRTAADIVSAAGAAPFLGGVKVPQRREDCR